MMIYTHVDVPYEVYKFYSNAAKRSSLPSAEDAMSSYLIKHARKTIARRKHAPAQEIISSKDSASRSR